MGEGLDPMGVLAAARQIEEFGIEFYRRFSECAREEKGAALLRGLARDEVHHKERIEKEMRRIAPGTDPSTVAPGRSLLNIVPEKAFPFPPDRCLTLEDEIAALEIGIQVEMRSIEMYRGAALMVQEAGVRELLEKLTRVEEGHRQLLEENMYQLRNEGAWYGYSPILEG
jgi:rubrerythrin